MRPKRFTREQALQLIYERELDFLDLCQLMLAYSDKVDGSIKWDHPRLVVHIRQIATAARIAKKRGVQLAKT